LAHRMATEDTWDQAAFGEEVARPARDAHLAAGITKRALNHWCFANSKTIFRRVRTEPRFAEHVPVVVHANYHQPKPPRMEAVYNRWHLKEPNALDRFKTEQAFTVPAPTLEADFLHMINDGFVSGANTRDASAATTTAGCKPQASKHGISVSLHTRPLSTNCAGAGTDAALCFAAAAVARRAGGRRELILVVADSSQSDELRHLITSAKRTNSAANLLLVLTDHEALAAFSDDAPPLTADESHPTGSAGPRSISAPLDSTAGAAALAALRYDLIGKLAGWGYGVLHAAATTVFLSPPWESLYRDADIEAMSSGWDDGSAYGYNHVLDDPSMGFTRFCHGSRIVAYEPGFFFAMPTNEAIALTGRMRLHLSQLPASASSKAVSEAEREHFLHELWLPSHHEYASVGAVLRVMNYLCFVNSKVLFRQLRSTPGAAAPVAVQINYHHADAPARMAAAIHSYLDNQPAALKELPLAEVASSASSGSEQAEAPLSCERAEGSSGGTGELPSQLVARSPYAWGGVGDMTFLSDGTLRTPWGDGKWGLHSPSAIYADFVGAKHNVRMLPSGMGVSTRCSDNNVVLVRSIKSAKEKQR